MADEQDEKRAGLEAFLMERARNVIASEGRRPSMRTLQEWKYEYIAEQTLIAQAESEVRRLVDEAEFPF